MHYEIPRGQDFQDHFPGPENYPDKHQVPHEVLMQDQYEEGQNYNPRSDSPTRNIQKEREEQSREYFEGNLPNNTFQKLFKQPVMRKPSNFTHDQNSIQLQTDVEGENETGTEQPNLTTRSPIKSKQSKQVNSQGLSESAHARSGVQIFEVGKMGFGQQMNTTGFHSRTDRSK